MAMNVPKHMVARIRFSCLLSAISTDNVALHNWFQL
jgi:hypothetical protein